MKELVRKHKYNIIQWKRCLESVSLGIYSATNSLSSPSAQHPIRFTNLLCLTFPTPAASDCLKPKQTHSQAKTGQNRLQIEYKWLRELRKSMTGKEADQTPTTNCWASGQETLEKRFTATSLLLPSFPLYTTLGAFSPLSETINSLLKPLVAALSSTKLYSLKAGTWFPSCSTWSPSSIHQHRPQNFRKTQSWIEKKN